MNLELPFPEPDASALDERFAALDRELDELFLEEVDRALRGFRADRTAAAGDAAA